MADNLCFDLTATAGLFHRNFITVFDDFHGIEDFFDRLIGGKFHPFDVEDSKIVTLFLRNNIIDRAASTEIDHLELGDIFTLGG